MRLNINKYNNILNEKGLTNEEVRKSTGFSEKTFNWILEHRFAEVYTIERIADALSVKPAEIMAQDPLGTTENVIEWERGTGTATATAARGRIATRIKKLSQKYPDKCEILAENKDGSIVAHIPAEWVRINPSMDLTDEQREKLSERAHRNFVNVD